MIICKNQKLSVLNGAVLLYLMSAVNAVFDAQVDLTINMTVCCVALSAILGQLYGMVIYV